MRRTAILSALPVLILSNAFASTSRAQNTQAGRPAQTIVRAGSQSPSKGAAEYFTGNVTVTPLFSATETTPHSGAYVTFEAGARSAWHVHPAGQRLVVTSGVGRTAEWGGPVQEIRMGDVIWCPPGVKHWHGAMPTTAMTHLALGGTVNSKSVEWLEKVSDEQYNALAQAPQLAAVVASTTAAQPTRAQTLMGDIAPKLAELTDNVLFGDVWERPGLSKRDRSLTTVAALIAMNRPDQLRSHLALARQNGVTQDELMEAITHLAFYSGWPNAVTAVGVAKEVFETK